MPRKFRLLALLGHTAVLVCAGLWSSSLITVPSAPGSPSTTGRSQLSSDHCRQSSASGLPPLREQHLSQVSSLRIPQTPRKRLARVQMDVLCSEMHIPPLGVIKTSPGGELSPRDCQAQEAHGEAGISSSSGWTKSSVATAIPSGSWVWDSLQRGQERLRRGILTAEEAAPVEAPPIALHLLSVVNRATTGTALVATSPVRHGGSGCPGAGGEKGKCWLSTVPSTTLAPALLGLQAPLNQTREVCVASEHSPAISSTL